MKTCLVSADNYWAGLLVWDSSYPVYSAYVHLSSLGWLALDDNPASKSSLTIGEIPWLFQVSEIPWLFQVFQVCGNPVMLILMQKLQLRNAVQIMNPDTRNKQVFS